MIRLKIILDEKENDRFELAEAIRYGLAEERKDLGLHLSFDQAGNMKSISIATEGTFKRIRESS